MGCPWRSMACIKLNGNFDRSTDFCGSRTMVDSRRLMVQTYRCAMAKLYSLFPKPWSGWYHADGATNNSRYVNNESSPWERDREPSGDSYPESPHIPCRSTPFWLHSTYRVTISGNEKQTILHFRYGSFVSLYHCVHRIVAPWFEIWQDSGWELGRDSSIDVMAARNQAIQFDSPINSYVCSSWESNNRESIDGDSMLLRVGWRAAWVMRLWFVEDWSSEMRYLPFLAQPRDIIINGINMHNHVNKCINILWQELIVYIEINNTLVNICGILYTQSPPGHLVHFKHKHQL